LRPTRFLNPLIVALGCSDNALSDQPGLIAIINDARSARGHRDKVIRGQWHLGRKKGKLGTAITVIKRRPKFEARIQKHVGSTS
jgi:hypothetical protein